MKLNRAIPIALLFIFLSTEGHTQKVIFQDDFEKYQPGTDISTEGYIVQGATVSVSQDGLANGGENYIKSDALQNNLYIKRKFKLEAGRTYEWKIATKIEGGFKHRMRVVSLSNHEYGLNELTNDDWQTSSIKLEVLPGAEEVYLQFYRWAKTELSLDEFVLTDTEETEPEVNITRVSSIFADNMVLQRNTEVGIWGKDAPGKEVTVTGSWGANSLISTDDQGSWITKLETPEAGGPYELQISGTDTVFIQNVLVGEVWLTSGQSNMQLTLNKSETADGATEAIANSANNNIRYFEVGRDVSFEKQDQVYGTWKISDPAVSGGFSAVSYFFADMLEDSLNIPVGIICAPYGAANIEAFIDLETLENFSFIDIPDIMHDPVQKTPTVLYNTMIHPLIGFGVKGVLWYQGEANRANPDEYAQLFPAMVDSWRTKFGLGDFPFYFVQLAPFNAGTSNFDFWQMQLNAAHTIPFAGLVSTLDIGDCENIHPLKKKEVGERLALWALANDYGFDAINYWSPICRGFEKDGSNLILYFDHLGEGLVLSPDPVSQFELAGSDGVYYAAQAFLKANNTITLSSIEVNDPVSARYLFGNCLTPTLFTKDGLPALMFESSTILNPSHVNVLAREVLKLYPNPVRDKLFLMAERENHSIQIFNIHGQKIMEAADKNIIDVSMFASGVYLLRSNAGIQMFVKE